MARSKWAIPSVLGLAMGATALAATLIAARPVPVSAGPTLDETVPRQFGEWREIPSAAPQVDPTTGVAGEPNMDRPYDDVLMRAYANARGDVILLALAYGRNQRQEVKIHRPEVCYTAQGFELVSRAPVEFPITDSSGRHVSGTRMLVEAPGRVEAVSYWIRIGNLYSDNAWAIRYHIFREGIAGRTPDGILVRASQIIAPGRPVSDEHFEKQERFLAELVEAMGGRARKLLVN